MKTKTTLKHTPGPWYAHGGVIFSAPADCRVATCVFQNASATAIELHQNARLIAAAPELLAALRDLLAILPPDDACTLSDCGGAEYCAYCAARAAIDKID